MNRLARIARRVASAWGFRIAQGGQPPTIPGWVFEYYAKERLAYVPSEETDADALAEAKESINVTLPRFMGLLKTFTGDRYFANSSTRRHQLYYFFSPSYPIDTYSLYVRPQGDKVLMVLGYIPTKVNGTPDLAKALEVRGPATPEASGFVLMMLAKKLLAKVKTQQTV